VDCVKCSRPSLLPDNLIAYGLIKQYSSILVNEGVINPDGIRLMFELENITEDEQTLLAQKIIRYITTAISKSREKG